MRVFITGATGFAGSHLTTQLLAEGHELWALVHQQTSHQLVPDHERLHWTEGNIVDREGLAEAVAAAQPDVIYHLAGQAFPNRSWTDPAHTLAVNTGGTANLLSAAVDYGRPRVVVVTSADMYGSVSRADLPIRESTEPSPRHPYGISKWAASQLAALYWRQFELPVVEARPFNHIGPDQALGFVVPDFASQLAAIKLGQREAKVLVGNLESQRDFTDVRDMARAYRALAASGKPGEVYLICSGHPVSIRRLLELMIELCECEVEIDSDARRARASDTPSLYGSYEKLRADTGWEPTLSLRQSLADALNDWLVRLSAAA